MMTYRKAAGLLAACVMAAGVAHAQPAQPAAEEACPAVSAAGGTVLSSLREAQLSDTGVPKLADVMAKLGPSLAAAGKDYAARTQRDWPDLCHYRAGNARLAAAGAAPQVVFMGDSITENWGYADPSLFGPNMVDRGVSGQTSGQILLRFYQDVVRLRPRLVHLNAGTNDLGSPVLTDDDIVNDVTAMIDIAQANHIRIVLAGILPSTGSTMFHRPGQPDRIRAINRRLSALAKARGLVFIDYAAVIGDAAGGIRAAFTNDGVHPNRAGYAAMRPLAERAIAQALR